MTARLADAPAALTVDYFDGQQARPQPVRLVVQQGRLHIDGEGIALQVPVRQVSWPERQRHGARQAYLPGHGMLSHADATAWDAWAAASGLRPSLVVWAMQSWRGALLALVLTVAALWAGYQWGLPWGAQALVAVVPQRLDTELGALVQRTLERDILQPSRLPEAQQAAVRLAFERAAAQLARQDGAAAVPAYVLLFRAMPLRPMNPQPPQPPSPSPSPSPDPDPGVANALALPGGAIIVTDAMVLLLADRPDVLLGVLGHELGHLRHRHGMRLLVQASLLGAVSAAVIGDFSAVLAAAPVLFGQAAYSRNFEFEADQAAARLLRANALSPAIFGVLFDRLQTARRQPGDGATPLPGGWGPGMASHPPDAERVRRMQAGE